MEQKRTIDRELASIIRFIGIISIIAGLIFLFIGIEAEINLNPYSLDAEALIGLPKEIAEKTNKTILGGFLIIIGIQLCSISTNLILEMRKQFTIES